LNDTLQYLFSRRNLGIKLGLERTFALLQACGEPGEALPIVQIAGTNGKGSTAAFLAAVLRKAGYTVGLSTSPHLVRVNERIRVNGIVIPDEEIVNFVKKYQKAIEEIRASFFEILTVMALWYFKQQAVDIAVMETGLGGRLDSVSAVKPLLTLMTPISLDHVEILGHSLEQIAHEKAGIFKTGIPCLSVKQQDNVWDVLFTEAKGKNTPLFQVDETVAKNWSLSLAGDHQLKNAALAIQAIQFLPNFSVTENQIRQALKNCKWPGRIQVIGVKPLIIFDVGHNEDGVRAFLNVFQKNTIKGNKNLVIALEARKNISGIIPDLEKEFDHIICTETESHSRMRAQILGNQFTETGKVQIEPDAMKALELGMKLTCPDDVLAIVGTHYLGNAVHNSFKITFE